MRSTRPSPSRSAAAKPTGRPPTEYLSPRVRVPPWFQKTLTVPPFEVVSSLLATATSNQPSPLKSPGVRTPEPSGKSDASMKRGVQPLGFWLTLQHSDGSVGLGARFDTR